MAIIKESLSRVSLHNYYPGTLHAAIVLKTRYYIVVLLSVMCVIKCALGHGLSYVCWYWLWDCISMEGEHSVTVHTHKPSLYSS